MAQIRIPQSNYQFVGNSFTHKIKYHGHDLYVVIHLRSFGSLCCLLKDKCRSQFDLVDSIEEVMIANKDYYIEEYKGEEIRRRLRWIQMFPIIDYPYCKSFENFLKEIYDGFCSEVSNRYM
jgi:hypothetical protein